MIDNAIQFFRAFILGCVSVAAAAIAIGISYAVLKGIWDGLHHEK